MSDNPSEHPVFFLMERALRRIREKTQQIFKTLEVDLTVEQWIIMKKINKVSGVSQSQLASSTFRDPAALTRTLDVLSRKGYVRRTPNPNDRRAYEVFLTKEGIELIVSLSPVIESVPKKALEDIPEEKIKALMEISDQIYKNLP